MSYLIKNFNKKYFILAILAFCFLAMRLSLLFTEIKHIDMNEETVCGLLANDMIYDHLRLPLLDYQHVEWCGDTLVVGFLAIPFFLIFGNSIISLKLVPFCFSLGTLIMWYLFLNKYINRTVAIVTSILFIVPPPYYTRLSLIAAIPHTELNFFSIAVIFLFFKIIHKTDHPLSLILFGILSGLGIYCHYLFLITFSTCALVWYVWDKRFILKKSFLIFSFSFFIGLIPWIISNIHNYPLGLPIIRGSFNPILQLRKCFRLIVYNIPHSFGFEYIDGIGMKLQSGIYYLIFVSFFVALIIHYRKSLLNLFVAILPSKKFMIQSKESIATLFILILLFLYVIFFTLNNFHDVTPFVIALGNIYDFTKPPLKIYRYRYLVPIYPFIFTIISLGLYYFGLKSKKSINRFLAGGVIFYLLTLGLYSNCKLISWNKFGQGFIYKGYRQWEFAHDITRQDWGFKKIADSISELEGEAKFHGFRLLGGEIANKHHSNLVPAIKHIEEVSSGYRYYLYLGMINRLTAIYLKDPKRIIGLIHAVPPESKPFCYEGYGLALGYRLLKSRWDAYDTVKSLPKIEKTLYKELVTHWRTEPKWDILQYIKTINEVEEKYKPFCYIGLGKFLAREEATRNSGKCINTINIIDDKFKKYCCLGFGQEMGELFNNLNMNFLNLSQIPKPLRKFFFEEVDSNLNQFTSLIDKTEKYYKPYVYEGLGIAIRKNIEEKAVIDYLLNKIDLHYRNDYLKGLTVIDNVYSGILQSRTTE